MPLEPIARSAVICGPYRYRLDRDFGNGHGVAAGIMVNPSTADGSEDDATIRKWLGLALRMGWRRVVIGNLFAFRATDVRKLRDASRAGIAVGPDNDRHIEEILRGADVHLVAWGSAGKIPVELRDRWREVVQIADRVGCRLQCFGVARDGHPLHPLMLSYDRMGAYSPWDAYACAR